MINKLEGMQSVNIKENIYRQENEQKEGKEEEGLQEKVNEGLDKIA